MHFRAVATGHLWIYGIIGEPQAGVKEKYYSFKNFRDELDLEADDYTVHIYSPGGDVFEGLAIYNGLKNTGKPIKVLIEGPTASIATLIAGVADPGKLIVNTNSAWLVHDPTFDRISGNAEQLRTGADQLDQIKTLLINVYKKRTGLSDEQLWDIIKQGKWMLPEEAKTLGFVDEVVESMRMVAYADFNKLTMEDKSLIQQSIDNLTNTIKEWLKPKNNAPKNMTDTLADGTVIEIGAEDGEWVGKSVYYADGSLLPPGEYTLASGVSFTVAEGGTITTVKEAEIENKEEMKASEELIAAKAENEALKAQIAELKSAVEARNEVAAQATARATNIEKDFKTKLVNIEAELAKIKNTTVGDQTPPDLGAKKGLDMTGPVIHDPLTAFVKTHILEKRNTD